MGGLDLYSLEYEQVIELINLFISLYSLNTALLDLLKSILELI